MLLLVCNTLPLAVVSRLESMHGISKCNILCKLKGIPKAADAVGMMPQYGITDIHSFLSSLMPVSIRSGPHYSRTARHCWVKSTIFLRENKRATIMSPQVARSSM